MTSRTTTTLTRTGDEPIVSCWAEGLLRGGGSGLWDNPAGFPRSPFGPTIPNAPPRPALSPGELETQMANEKQRLESAMMAGRMSGGDMGAVSAFYNIVHQYDRP